MKTEISRDSHQPERRYSGVYQQQGRMLTDADWNELVEILKERLNSALRDVVGNKAGSMGGTPRHRPLRVRKKTKDDPLTIQPGHIYVDGVAAQIPGSKPLTFAAQLDFPEAPDLPKTPDFPGSPPKVYIIYADVWERTVTQLMDECLRDKGLHGADTCTRKQMMAQVKWCPAAIDPEQSVKNPPKGDAELSLELMHKTTEPDPCDPCAAQLDVESKVGNYLFRVEVHDVKGDADDPTEIILKWSSENGAGQFEALSTKEEMPAGFITDKWVYEFFDKTSERHLGVHLGVSPWQPVRGVLKEMKEPYSVPPIPGSKEKEKFVRRWDGYCKLDLSSGTLIGGMDRGVVLSTTTDSDAPGYVEIGTSLHINLSSVDLDIALDGKKFVAGDYWLAAVREAEHDPLDPKKNELIKNALPNGIEHHYLTLGEVVDGVLQPNPEADRKYAFPPLTEMTRMFIAGGDGQEVVPGEALAQPLRVGVANGEWPVAGATVRFQIESGGGSLSPADGGKTNADGIAECEWTPGVAIGDKCRVRATLVDPDHPGDASKDLDPPVYFYANLITADQVAYEPGCPDSGENAVHSLLAEDETVSLDLGEDAYYTVKEVLDALLCNLRAKHIPYDPTNLSRWEDVNEEEGAAAPDTVQEAIDALLENLQSEDIKYPLPDCSPDTNTLESHIADDIANVVNEEGIQYARISDLWDALLCHLDAAKLPLDKSDEDLCADFSAAQTVQDALKVLCDRPTGTGGGCKVSVGDHGEFPTIEEAIKALTERYDFRLTTFNLCLLPGEHVLPPQSFFDALSSKLNRQFSLFLCGSGMESTFLRVGEPMTLLEMHTFCSKNLTIVGGDDGIMHLTLDCEQIRFDDVHFEAFIQDAANAALILDGREQVHVANCTIMACHDHSFDLPERVFHFGGDFDILAELFSKDIVLVRPIFLREARQRSMYLAQPDQIEMRNAFAREVSVAIKEHARELTTEETASYYRLVASLAVKDLDGDVELLARRLAGDLDRVRIAAAGAAASRDPVGVDYDQVVAVMIPIAQADCLFDHNDIIGRFSVYGMPPRQSPAPNEIREMHGNLLYHIQAGRIRFQSTQRKFQLHNNHLTQLLVAERVIEELKGYGEGRGTLDGVFETMLLSDNVFRAANNYFVTRGHSFTATRFDHESDLGSEGEASQPAGIVFGDNAVYVGTVGKSEFVNPEGDRIYADIKLYDTTRNPREFIPTESATFRLEIVRSMPH